MEDEERIVIFFVVIVCCVVVMVVDVRCESVGCSSVVALATVVVLMRSRGRYCLSESAVHQVAFRGVSFRAILCQIVVLLFSFSSASRTCLPESQRENLEHLLLSKESQECSNKKTSNSQSNHALCENQFRPARRTRNEYVNGIPRIAPIDLTRTSSWYGKPPTALLLRLFVSEYPRSINWRHRRYVPQIFPLIASSAGS